METQYLNICHHCKSRTGHADIKPDELLYCVCCYDDLCDIVLCGDENVATQFRAAFNDKDIANIKLTLIGEKEDDDFIECCDETPCGECTVCQEEVDDEEDDDEEDCSDTCRNCEKPLYDILFASTAGTFCVCEN